MPEVILSAADVSVKYGSQLILDRASLVLHESERAGMVGRNGSGKSTFLRMAAGALDPDSGKVVRRRDLVTGYLPQVFDLADEQTVHQNILSGAQRVLDLIHAYEDAEPGSGRSSELLDQINHADGWQLEHQVKRLVTHLNAPAEDRVVGSLSGGEKRRVALCRALLARPDFLILDEPTNHLDTESIEWLEEFLARYTGACLFVTHDRYFLDRIATRIIEVSGGRFFSHEGNYTDYLLAKASRDAVQEQQEQGRQKFLKRELEWIRRAPRARRTKSQDRIERYYSTAAQEAPEPELNVELIIPPAPKLGNRVIDLSDVTMQLGDRVLFRGLTLSIEAGARIGIVGRNGVGKTTLLRLILGELTPSSGTVETGPRTQINYIDQGRLQLDDQKTVFQEIGGNSEHLQLGEETITVRAYLRRFLFTEDRINTKIELLSGGERSRVTLAKVLKRGGNVLILDEPTNDLDLATLRLLEEALAAFGGAVIVVSHDRYFLNRICTNIIAFEGNGRVVQSVGNYEYYLEKKSARTALPAREERPVERTTSPTATPRKLKWAEARELEGIEATILGAEDEVKRLQELFASPEFYRANRTELPRYEAELASARAAVARLYSRWEELERLKTAQA